MKKRIYNQVSLFGPLTAYLVVISPPDAVKLDIAALKKELDTISEIGEKNIRSIAHITLIDKLTDDASFPDMIKKLIKKREPFPVTINGWDYFDHGHSFTIYLKIENTAPIIQLINDIKPGSALPHVTLAKKISRETFDKLKPYLQNFTYRNEWVCKEIVVLKKLMSQKPLGFKEKFVIPLK